MQTRVEGVEGRSRRFQRSRRKGWRMPDGAVYVGRPTKWGNPHRVGWCRPCAAVHTPEEAVLAFREDLEAEKYLSKANIRRELHGKDLVCWCPPDQACHADVLLEVANS